MTQLSLNILKSCSDQGDGLRVPSEHRVPTLGPHTGHVAVFPRPATYLTCSMARAVWSSAPELSNTTQRSCRGSRCAFRSSSSQP